MAKKTKTTKKPRSIVCYMDKVDFDHELGNALGGNRIFASAEDLAVNKPCTAECGIVEVEVRLKRVIKESDFSIKPDKEYMLSVRDENGKYKRKKVLGKDLIAERAKIKAKADKRKKP